MSQAKLRTFIGFCNDLRQFVSNFACIPSPLISIQRESQAIALGKVKEEELTGLQTLQEKLIYLQVLALSRKDWGYALDIGASE